MNIEVICYWLKFAANGATWLWRRVH